MIARTVLIDAGPLVALLYGQDAMHQSCVELSRDLPQTLFTCWPVVTEAAYLLRSSRTGVSQLLSEIERRRFQILPLVVDDIAPVAAILKRYHDQEFDFADACLMYLAEREGIDHVFTLDRRHFSVYRTKEGASLNLVRVPR